MTRCDECALRRDRDRRRRSGPDVRDRSGPARSPGAGDRAQPGGRAQDPDLGRWALQFHEPRGGAGELPLEQPRLLPFGAGALHAGRLRRLGREARHRLAREEARAALLRRQRASDRLDAHGRMRGGGRRDPLRPGGRRRRSDSRLRAAHESGRAARRGAGDRDGWALDPQAGRDGLRAARRATLRRVGHADAPWAGPAALRG